MDKSADESADGDPENTDSSKEDAAKGDCIDLILIGTRWPVRI